MNFFQKRKITKAALKAMEQSLAKQMEDEARKNHLLQTDNFVEVINELFTQCKVPGQIVTITFANGNKVEIKKTTPTDELGREFDKPYF